MKKISYGKKETRRYHVLPPFLCGSKKATALLEQWNKDNVVNLPEVDFLPSIRDRKKRRIAHTVERMVILWNSASLLEDKH